MSSNYQPDLLQKIILAGIEQHAKEIMNEEIKTAQANIERRVREKTAEIAVGVLKEMTFERFGHDIRITVKFPQA